MTASSHRRRALLFVAAAAALWLPRPAQAQGPKLFVSRITVESPLNNPSDIDVNQQLCGNNVAGGFGPQIEFEQNPQPGEFAPGCISNAYPGTSVRLVVNVAHSSEVTSVDVIEFQLFKFAANTNPLDEGSAPPLRTFYIFNLGGYNCATDGGSGEPSCASIGNSVHNANGVVNVHRHDVDWNGFYNIQGVFGKTNGQYGFRATVQTKQTTSQSGSIDLKNTVAYPAANNNGDNQFPINVDVVNYHSINSSPTLVGLRTPVAAQPYNLFYRISKDALTTIEIFKPIYTAPFELPVRTIVNGLPRVGEGTPSGALTNGDFWDGRDNNGNVVSSGTYIARISGVADDVLGRDYAYPVERVLAIDPLQVTDVAVAPLTGSNTSLAVINYVLTEPATVYVDIWSPDTRFVDTDRQYDVPTPNNNRTIGTLIRRMVEHKTSRSNQFTFWDGRDSSNNPVRDNNYVYTINALLPTYDQNGTAINLQNSKPAVGFVAVSRGMVGISQISPTTSVFGSSPAISGLPPFRFGYSLTRDAYVTINILDPSGALVKTLVNNEIRPGGQLTVETWLDGIKDNGQYPSSGSYIAQLYAKDTLFSEKVSTTSASFPINLARITDVVNTPLLAGSSDVVRLDYTMSQGMDMTWNIYPPGTIIPGSGAWPPTPASITLAGGGQASPVFSLHGMRPGRNRLSEIWDGRNSNGLFVPDGQYLFTLTAKSTTTPVLVATDRIIGSIMVARGQIIIPQFTTKQTVPTAANGGQTAPLPPVQFDYTLTRQSSATLRILDTNVPPSVVRTLASGDVRDANIVNSDFWDGRDEAGNFVPAGFYTAQLIAADLASDFSNPTTAQLTVSIDPLRIYDIAVSALRKDSFAQVVYTLSEPMKIVLKIFKPGTTFDQFGAPSPPEAVSLVKRIVGVRPARETVTENWDGRDLQLTDVPDGNYLFKLVATPEISRVDSVTGTILPSTVMASDIIINELPVTRAATENAAADFERNTILYPNPSTGASVKFRVRVPVQARLSVRLYTINGDLVKTLSTGDFTSESSYPSCGASDSYCDYTWNRDNAAGKKVAPGVYFAVIREEGTLGEAQVFQVVKKILLQ